MTLVRFTVDLAAVSHGRRGEEVGGLVAALPREFPAFSVCRLSVGIARAALVVASADGTPPGALERLVGWGYGRLELRG